MKKIPLTNRPFGPFPTVLVGAEVKGKPNYLTVGACGVVSMQPVLYVSLKDSHYTTRGIKENGYFSVNIPAADLVQQVDYCGITSGHQTDKSSLFTSFYDALGKAPMAEECRLNFLCKVIETIPVFDFQMFLGEIVAAYSNEDCLTEGVPDPLKINPLIMMGANYYDLDKAAGAFFQTGLALLPNKQD